jgi:hypothetical protein
VHWDALDADLDAELPAGVVGIAALAPDRELEAAAVVREDAHVHHTLPVSWVVEDDQELLGEVLEHLDVVVVDVKLVAEGVPEVTGLGVMAIAAEPTHRDPADELVATPADVTSGRNHAETARGSSSRVTGVPRGYHALLASDHLLEGAVVDLVWAVVGAELVSGGGVVMLQQVPLFMQ